MSDKEDSLFGSGSDAEEQPHAPQDNNEDAATPERREQYDGLFGDEEDEDEEQDVPGTAAKRNRKTYSVERHSTFVVQPPSPSTIRTVKLSNMINIKAKPFNPETHEAGSDLVMDQFGNQRLNLHHLNTVRWRWTTDPATGERVPQSNARFVRWEDGSTTLHIGEEVLSVAEVKDQAARRYLYVRVNGLMQVWVGCGCGLYLYVHLPQVACPQHYSVTNPLDPHTTHPCSRPPPHSRKPPSPPVCSCTPPPSMESCTRPFSS